MTLVIGFGWSSPSATIELAKQQKFKFPIGLMAHFSNLHSRSSKGGAIVCNLTIDTSLVIVALTVIIPIEQ